MFKMFNNTYSSDVVLGEEYREPRSGLQGHAVSLHFYEHGCERLTIAAWDEKNRKLEEYTFDVPAVVRVKTGRVPVSDKTGGPKGLHNV